MKWEDCVPPYAVEERAFMNHNRGANKGLPCDPNPSVHTVGERMATSRAKGRVMNSIERVGLLEQQRLILLQVLSDPSIRDISLSIGINMKEIKLGQQLLRCARKLIRRSQNSPDKNRTLSLAKKKQPDIAKGIMDGWILLTKDEQRSKYTDKLISALEYWIENNNLVQHSAFKDNLVIKQDRNGSIVRDLTTGVPVRLQKMMQMCNPRVLHNHMIEHFDDATEGNHVLISETKIRELLKTLCSHIKKMSACEKIMCGGENCIVFNDIHKCLNLYQK